MPTRRKFTAEQEREIVALYLDRDTSLESIKETYGIVDSRLYAILNRHNTPRRLSREFPTPELPALSAPAPLTITTDANGLVQTVERARPVNVKLYTWEVRFESAMRVEAASITEAIAEVAKLPMCRRVFNVALKGSL